MKKFLQAAATKLQTTKAKVVGVATSASLALMNAPITAHASNTADLTFDGNLDPTVTGPINQIIRVLMGVMGAVGIFFVLSGAFKLVMAYRNDQPEAQAAAAKDLVIGIVLVLFGTIFTIGLS